MVRVYFFLFNSFGVPSPQVIGPVSAVSSTNSSHIARMSQLTALL